MVYSTPSDFGIGVLVYYFWRILPIVLLIPAILTEQLIFTVLLEEHHSWLNTVIINIVSTILGFLSPWLKLDPLDPIAQRISEYYPRADLYYGNPSEVLGLVVVLSVAVMCLISVVVEGIILTCLVGGYYTSSLHKLWLATLVANVASYFVIGVLIFAGLSLLAIF